MVKTIGFILGTLMLVDGLTDTISPRWGFKVWEHNLRRYMPGYLNRVTDEYSHLSDNALRYVTVWQVLVALTMIWLASRARD